MRIVFAVLKSERPPEARFSVPYCERIENGVPDCQIMMPLKAHPPSQRLRFISAEGEERPYVLLPRTSKHLEDAKLGEGKQAVLSYYTLPTGMRVATWIRPGQTPRPYLDDLTVRVNSEPVDLKPGAHVAHQFMLYHGPVKTMLLGQMRGERSVSSQPRIRAD